MKDIGRGLTKPCLSHGWIRWGDPVGYHLPACDKDCEVEHLPPCSDGCIFREGTKTLAYYFPVEIWTKSDAGDWSVSPAIFRLQRDVAGVPEKLAAIGNEKILSIRQGERIRVWGVERDKQPSKPFDVRAAMTSKWGVEQLLNEGSREEREKVLRIVG